MSYKSMVILQYQKKFHKEIIDSCVHALRQGKVVAYPTDTSYGLAADSENSEAIRKLYRIKERRSGQPIHIIIPSVAYGKKLAHFDRRAEKMAQAFWPGPLTLVLWLKSKKKGLVSLSGGTGTLGMRMPDNAIALDLARRLGRGITTTSANPSMHISGGYDSYSAQDVTGQFAKKKFRPDIVLDAGKLSKRKPSTVIRLLHEPYEILRVGPVSEKQIKKIMTKIK